MRVAELADAGGVSADTVRFYTRQGLLRPARDPGNGYRHYSASDLSRLRFITRARQLGLSLQEIGQVFEQADHGDSPCPMVREVVQQRLVRLREQIAELQQLEQRMSAALAAWANLPDGMPRGDHVCHLIEDWQGGQT